jgi:hypothetical protein
VDDVTVREAAGMIPDSDRVVLGVAVRLVVLAAKTEKKARASG